MATADELGGHFPSSSPQPPEPSHGGFGVSETAVPQDGVFHSRLDLPGTASAPGRARRAPRTLRWVGEILMVLLGAAVIAVLLRMFVVQVYQIPSKSMDDTLQVGARIAVNRVPVLGKQVERGDVIVFQDSAGWLPVTGQGQANPLRSVGEFLGIVPPNGEQVVVKRVIGTAGDAVACCDAEGRLTVNGQPIDEPYVKDGLVGTTDFSVVVPDGSLWVMGDNRRDSADSLYHYYRNEQAFVSTDSVIGTAWAQIWPVGRWSLLADRSAFEHVPSP